MVKRNDIFERNKVSVIGCWLNNTSLFWQITIHWNSGYIEPRRRMKKFIFFDIVSFTLCCLESLILQHGADSSMVQGKYIKKVQNLLLYFLYIFKVVHYNRMNTLNLFYSFRRIPRRNGIKFLLRSSLDTFY